MELTELRARLDGEFTYPVDLETVVREVGTVRVEGPNGDGAETIGSVLGPLGTDSFESADVLYDTIYGNVSDDHVGRKYYDDRGGTHSGADDGPRDAANVSF